jgi:hypothetical protein
MEEILPYLFWIFLVLYFIFGGKKKNVPAKNTPQSTAQKASNFEQLLNSIKAQVEAGNTMPVVSAEAETIEGEELTDSTPIQKLKPIQAYPVEKRVTATELSKPQKAVKPINKDKHQDQHDAYKIKGKTQNSLVKTLRNPTGLRNAFIVGEIFKKRF